MVYFSHKGERHEYELWCELLSTVGAVVRAALYGRTHPGRGRACWAGSPRCPAAGSSGACGRARRAGAQSGARRRVPTCASPGSSYQTDPDSLHLQRVGESTLYYWDSLKTSNTTTLIQLRQKVFFLV